MSKIEIIGKIPHVLGLPCIRDKYYRFSSAEFLGLTEWLCPHCFTNLAEKDNVMSCLNDCHKNKRKSNHSADLEE